jgi:glycosyltransferase involved in cell wall biosynthesis
MVTVAIASIDTRIFTELAIRTAVLRAGCAVRVIVGDSGSTDGTLAMLDRLRARYVDDVEVAPSGRKHGEWLDHWVATVDDDLVAFVDSDIEFRRDGWLVDLMERRELDDAAIVGAEWVPEFPAYVIPGTGERVRLSGRPAPWLQLIHRPSIASLGCSYTYHAEPTSTVPEGMKGYDVGAWVAECARRAGHAVSIMPDEYQHGFHHYRGRSWTARGRGAALQHVAAAVRLARVRAFKR